MLLYAQYSFKCLLTDSLISNVKCERDIFHLVMMESSLLLSTIRYEDDAHPPFLPHMLSFPQPSSHPSASLSPRVTYHTFLFITLKPINSVKSSLLNLGLWDTEAKEDHFLKWSVNAQHTFVFRMPQEKNFPFTKANPFGRRLHYSD